MVQKAVDGVSRPSVNVLQQRFTALVPAFADTAKQPVALSAARQGARPRQRCTVSSRDLYKLSAVIPTPLCPPPPPEQRRLARPAVLRVTRRYRCAIRGVATRTDLLCERGLAFRQTQGTRSGAPHKLEGGSGGTVTVAPDPPVNDVSRRCCGVREALLSFAIHQLCVLTCQTVQRKQTTRTDNRADSPDSTGGTT